MRPDRPKVNFTFADPNSPREIQKALMLMIVEKLIAEKAGN